MTLRDIGLALGLLPKLLRKTDRSFAKVVGGKRVIFDCHRRLNADVLHTPSLNLGINKEQRSRDIIFDVRTPGGAFVEIGGGDGKLQYLLGIRGNLEIDQALYLNNRAQFDGKFKYFGLDLKAVPERSVLGGDICSPEFPEDMGAAWGNAAVVYSNNVFEHLRRPWLAAKNVYGLLKVGGVCITVVPFSQRYHESPGDFFRYTHAGITALFEDVGPLETIDVGYDILGRRMDWQGTGNAHDTVPVDEFGAWRETWFTFFAFRKLS